MKLSTATRRILSEAHLDAEQSVAALAKTLRMKPHTVRRALAQSTAQGLIIERPFIDYFALGFIQYEVLLSLSSHRKRSEILKWLSRHPHVLWFAEVGANYSLGFSLIVKNPGDVARFLEELVKLFGSCVYEVQTASILSFTLLRKTYLVGSKPRTGKDRILTDSMNTVPTSDVDEIDIKILALLNKSGAASQRELAAQLKLPRSTFDYRIQKLKSLGVLKGKIYGIRALTLGLQIHKLFIKTRGVGPKLRDRMDSFVLREAEVINFFRCLGAWDFEMVIETPSASEVTQIRERLFEEFEDVIIGIDIVPIFAQGVSTEFLQAV